MAVLTEAVPIWWLAVLRTDEMYHIRNLKRSTTTMPRAMLDTADISQSPTFLDRLPPEIIQNIFALLPFQHLLRCRLVRPIPHNAWAHNSKLPI